MEVQEWILVLIVTVTVIAIPKRREIGDLIGRMIEFLDPRRK
jgi:hypothetical protein